MIILTYSEAREYGIGIAQLIPVFLIALFVVDNRYYIKATKMAERGSRKWMHTARKLVAKYEKQAQKLVKALVRIDSILIGLEMGDSPPDGQSRRAYEAQLSKRRDKAVAEYRELKKVAAEVSGMLDRSPRLRAELDKSTDDVTGSFNRLVIYIMLSGVVAEIFALWTAIGLLSPLYGIAWTTNISIIMVGLLSKIAMDRLMRVSNRPRFNEIGWVWISFMVVIAQITFAWILHSVRVIHS